MGATRSYERERRFVVTDLGMLDGHTGNLIIQAYIFISEGYVVRVRRTHVPTGEENRLYQEGPAILAAKGPRVEGMREEYETEIPPTFAAELIRRSPWKLSKTRHQIVEGDHLWDIDVFHGDNDGLAIAECEGAGLASLKVPAWCGPEVTGDRRYDNERLARQPFSTWPAEGRVV